MKQHLTKPNKNLQLIRSDEFNDLNRIYISSQKQLKRVRNGGKYEQKNRDLG